ncbi:MAG: hypothetical protein DRP74_08590 [Candidatus Omnitrophota bacterium]|nr:MAG: hypothetical protein DRP74_08590 [Candidatus Omnitrophota bacterium]
MVNQEMVVNKWVRTYKEALQKYEGIKEQIDELEHTLEMLHVEYRLLKNETEGIEEGVFSAEISHPMTHVRALEYLYRELKIECKIILKKLEEIIKDHPDA